MESGAYIDLAQETILVLIKISLPLLLAALVVGLLVSLFQALTQIQEQTLSFVPKILAIFLMLLLTLGFIGHTMKVYSEDLMSKIIHVE